MPNLLEKAMDVARQVHFQGGLSEKRHPADGLVDDLLVQSLNDSSQASRYGRSLVGNDESLWADDTQESFADAINNLPTADFEDERDQFLKEHGLLDVEDTYKAERVNNRRTEVLTRRVEGLIYPGTPVVNNFYTTIRQDPDLGFTGQREYVDVVESFNEMGYHAIDIDEGDIPSFSPAFSQDSQRINPRMQMYGIKVEYKSKLRRVFENFAVPDILAMMTVGWSQASAEVRERDATNFLFKKLAPRPILSNKPNADAPLGTASGMSINAYPNGTLDVDRDVPRIIDYMQYQEGLSLANLIMLMPKNAWPFMNMRKGYRRFLGRDGDILHESPQFTEGPRGALNNPGGFPTNAEQYGVKARGVGYSGPAAAAQHLANTRAGESQLASNQMPAGPMPFLPRRVPNLMNEFRLPNSAFGPMSVVLTDYQQADYRYYADDGYNPDAAGSDQAHPLRYDSITGDKRPVMTTDVLIFDGTRPLFFMESVPPTSWDYTNEEWQRSAVVMVEAFSMANRSRGQQAVMLESLVLDDNYTHEPRIDARDLPVTDRGLAGGMSDS